ncbi:hypothetical protein RFI_37529, partial [Reticulomyxa filosa]
FGNLDSSPNWKLRLAVYRHGGFLLIDFIFLPMFLVCLCFIYRGIKVVCLIVDTNDWDEQRMNLIRKTIFFEFVNLLIDIAVYFWMFAIVFAVGHRFGPWMIQALYSWKVFFHNRKFENQRQHVATDVSSQPQSIDNNNNNNNQSVNNAAPMGRLAEPEMSVRDHLLYNFIITSIDILLLLPSLLILVLTCYRLKRLSSIWCDRSRVRLGGTLKTGEDFYDFDLISRGKTIQQAWNVLLDLPCCCVAIVVYVTVWRAFTLHKLLGQSTSAKHLLEYQQTFFIRILNKTMSLDCRKEERQHGYNFFY